MVNQVAVLLVNYNMVERCDALVEHILKNVCWPIDLYVIDNGSDLVEPSVHTNVWIGQNVQTTGGWLKGLAQADARGKKYLAYWFLITSAEFPAFSGDVLTPMAEFMLVNEDAAGVHPALTADSTTHWLHLKDIGTYAPRRVHMIDNIAALWRADWFDRVGRFDPELRYAWGIDLETSWKARRDEMTLWVDERVRMRKVTDIGYKMDRMRMTARERRMQAGANMEAVLSRKYGATWHWRMLHEYS